MPQNTLSDVIGWVNSKHNLMTINKTEYYLACVAGPQFYGGPDLQRAGFWRAMGED